VEQLRNDMESLMQELQDLSKRNDELMSAKDADHQIIRELDMQMKDYKRKYEQAKTELRSVKGKSVLRLFTQCSFSNALSSHLPTLPASSKASG